MKVNRIRAVTLSKVCWAAVLRGVPTCVATRCCHFMCCSAVLPLCVCSAVLPLCVLQSGIETVWCSAGLPLCVLQRGVATLCCRCSPNRRVPPRHEPTAPTVKTYNFLHLPRLHPTLYLNLLHTHTDCSTPSTKRFHFFTGLFHSSHRTVPPISLNDPTIFTSQFHFSDWVIPPLIELF